uniref:Putative secreted protein n=1 Tax=Amblyomma americanum TaxID=6943 RepID=A0A0C9SDF1_AMBAM
MFCCRLEGVLLLCSAVQPFCSPANTNSLVRVLTVRWQASPSGKQRDCHPSAAEIVDRWVCWRSSSERCGRLCDSAPMLGCTKKSKTVVLHELALEVAIGSAWRDTCTIAVICSYSCAKALIILL